MRAREYLSQVYALEHDISRDKRIIQALEADAYMPDAIRYDKDKVQSSGGITLDDIVIRLMHARERLMKAEVRRIELYNQILDEVNGMPGDTKGKILQKEVLKMKYLDHRNFIQIANALIIDVGYAQKLHQRGCNEFEKLYLLSEKIQ